MKPSSTPATGSLVSAQSAGAVFLIFLRLGLTSFGGPVAHLGYFRTEFVERRKWLDDAKFSDVVALCQFLPGPASSQVGIAIGMMRAGWLGSVAAWLGFTLPSALLLIAFGYGMSRFGGLADSGIVHGLKVVAVAVVAQAVWGMAKSLCPDRPRAGLAIVAALLTLVLPSTLGQIGAIAASAVVGVTLLRAAAATPNQEPLGILSRASGVASLAVFALLLIGLPAAAQLSASPLLGLLDGFFRAGALVFGGGHVVLPLLQSVAVPSGAASNAEFLAGYGAAQAIPGPLFTFAAYLGTVMATPVQGWIGGLLFLVAIFAPAYLLVMGVLPFWDGLRQRATVRAALAGVNAGVVGILLSALYDPVWTSAISSRADFGLALSAFGLLVYGRVPPLAVVLLTAATGWLLDL
ncbi:chromate efflux transporter [Roseateles sp.]|uniref:chromate efflux transporter n=1 Tax=Roseateles sp. TaxID=1971397 RepID=UPI0025D123BD|nr:chromate efflux transporter [Roseateles sp.]MBV8036864.1 chromate efflux transporter [Roseateles sp.]